MAVINYTKTGAKSTKKASLPKEVFGLKVEDYTLLKQAYLTSQANSRVGSSQTKTRGQVRGGGRKPWRQKGTGRARAGSIRSPIWRGGGITFGPSVNKNYQRKLNKAAKQLALIQALSLKVAAGALAIVESFPEHKKTKEMAAFLSKVAGESKRILIVAEQVSDDLRRSCNNLAGVEVKSVAYLSVPAVMDADIVLMDSAAVKRLESRLGGKS